MYIVGRNTIRLLLLIPLNNPWILHSQTLRKLQVGKTIPREDKKLASVISVCVWMTNYSSKSQRHDYIERTLHNTFVLFPEQNVYLAILTPIPPPRHKKGTVLMNIQSFYFLAFSPLSLAPPKQTSAVRHDARWSGKLCTCSFQQLFSPSDFLCPP